MENIFLTNFFRRWVVVGSEVNYRQLDIVMCLCFVGRILKLWNPHFYSWTIECWVPTVWGETRGRPDKTKVIFMSYLHSNPLEFEEIHLMLKSSDFSWYRWKQLENSSILQKHFKVLQSPPQNTWVCPLLISLQMQTEDMVPCHALLLLLACPMILPGLHSALSGELPDRMLLGQRPCWDVAKPLPPLTVHVALDKF